MSNISQVSAKVIAHSKSSVTGKEMVTFEWEFPRLILAEVNTHKMLSKNTSSSRAIPVKTMLEQVRNNPAMPVRFGKANSGMQDAGEHKGKVSVTLAAGEKVDVSAATAWRFAAKSALQSATMLHEAGYAKQICNRLIEPFQRVKMVVSGTEWNNFFWLRAHEAADPTIEALAKAAKKSLDESTPVVLQPGEWHVPYYNDGYWKHCKEPLKRYAPMLVEGGYVEVEVDKYGNTLQQALDISMSCCAQASYRKLDDTIEKARNVVSRLNLNGENPEEPVHASPSEHQASPISAQRTWEIYYDPMGGHFDTGEYVWPEGITHMDRDGTYCSGNLKGFLQYRQLVPNHVKKG